MTGDTVSQVMFVAFDGLETPVVTRWSYHAEDPFAVTLAVQTPRGSWVEWLLGRELLVAGLVGEAGEGDVRVSWPQTRGRTLIVIEIRSGESQAILTLDRELLGRFLDATMELVPAGSELTMLDFDAEITKLTQSCAG